uniref:Ste24 endopeptidase n=1 Tax=Romanomermis culicivorax TaxID=13658 RepID=A0A915HHX0_ROMCU
MSAWTLAVKFQLFNQVLKNWQNARLVCSTIENFPGFVFFRNHSILKLGLLTMLSPDTIFWCCFIFGFISFLWELYLSYRQYKKQRDTIERPDYLHDLIDEDSFHKARAYSLDKARFAFAHDIWSAFENTVILLGGLIYLLWNFAQETLKSYGLEGEISQSMLFIFIASLINYVISFPWKIYSTFVVEEKHGFNKQTFKFFVFDQLKKEAVSLLIGLPLSAAVIWIIQKGGDYFFLFLWLFLLIMTFFLMTIYPEFIAPLFDKYTPLREGDLKLKIEALASKVHFPLKKLYVVEGSKRSAHSNAYMYGLWNNKRIVLYDTLIADYHPCPETVDQKRESSASKESSSDDKESSNGDWEKPDLNNEENNAEKVEDIQEEEKLMENEPEKGQEEKPKKKLGMSDDEVVAVLGHELGHWKLNHTVFNLIVAELNLLLCMILFSYLYKLPVLYEAFGFTESQPILIGLFVIFSFVFAPYNEVLNFAMTWWSRQCEFSADKFSAELGYAPLLTSGLIKLSKDNLSLPINDHLYSAWHHSHPPVPERIDALKKYK